MVTFLFMLGVMALIGVVVGVVVSKGGGIGAPPPAPFPPRRSASDAVRLVAPRSEPLQPKQQARFNALFSQQHQRTGNRTPPAAYTAPAYSAPADDIINTLMQVSVVSSMVDDTPRHQSPVDCTPTYEACSTSSNYESSSSCDSSSSSYDSSSSSCDSGSSDSGSF